MIILQNWKILKSFADQFYPDVEIISINPIGLRELFKDVYTESFLKAHPEINLNEVELLNERK